MSDTYTCSLGPENLVTIAEHADIETMHILTSAYPLKASFNININSIAANRILLEGRSDYDEKLANAFDELIAVASAKTDEGKSVESILETGFFLSARSSFHSELAGAFSTLASIDVTPTDSEHDEKEMWEDSNEHFYSPISPTSSEHIRYPISPTSKDHSRSPISPAREHFHAKPPPSPLRRQMS